MTNLMLRRKERGNIEGGGNPDKKGGEEGRIKLRKEERNKKK